MSRLKLRFLWTRRDSPCIPFHGRYHEFLRGLTRQTHGQVNQSQGRTGIVEAEIEHEGEDRLGFRMGRNEQGYGKENVNNIPAGEGELGENIGGHGVDHQGNQGRDGGNDEGIEGVELKIVLGEHLGVSLEADGFGESERASRNLGVSFGDTI